MRIRAKFKSDGSKVFEGELKSLLKNVWDIANGLDRGCSFEDFAPYDSCEFELMSLDDH